MEYITLYMHWDRRYKGTAMLVMQTRVFGRGRGHGFKFGGEAFGISASRSGPNQRPSLGGLRLTEESLP